MKTTISSLSLWRDFSFFNISFFLSAKIREIFILFSRVKSKLTNQRSSFCFDSNWEFDGNFLKPLYLSGEKSWFFYKHFFLSAKIREILSRSCWWTFWHFFQHPRSLTWLTLVLSLAGLERLWSWCARQPETTTSSEFQSYLKRVWGRLFLFS